jgi:hypothetical protein
MKNEVLSSCSKRPLHIFIFPLKLSSFIILAFLYNTFLMPITIFVCFFLILVHFSLLLTFMLLYSSSKNCFIPRSRMLGARYI